MHTLAVKTTARIEMLDITARIREIIAKAGVRDGICHIFVPHTTAAITINENADPDVARDIIAVLDELIPRHGSYRHREGNSAAHVQASLLGASETIMIENGRLVLGTWQGIYFCEFDGPRTRKVFVKAVVSP